MKKNSFLCMGWLPILLCSLLLLAITAGMKARDIEEKVKQSTVNALSDERFSWAKVETYNLGRSVLIAGTAPNTDVIEEALSIAHQAPGVLMAKHNGQAIAKPIELIQPELNLSLKDNEVTLSGTVASESDIDAISTTVNRAFNNHNVNQSLTVGTNIAALSSAQFLSSLNINSKYPKQVLLKLKDNALYLSGSVAHPSVSTLLEKSLNKTFDGQVNNTITVDRALCSELINNILRDTKINFETGKADISPESDSLLNKIVSAAVRCPEANYEVAGHTDATGNADFNLRLSQKRAQSVVTALTNKGLKTSQLKAKGYGPNNPIADNDTAEGRAKNRRIEFKISN